MAERQTRVYLQHCPCFHTGQPAALGLPHVPVGRWPVQPPQPREASAGIALGGSSSFAPLPPSGLGRRPTWPPAATGASGVGDEVEQEGEGKRQTSINNS